MRTEQLSIHKCATELATLATRILPDMNRAHRGLIGKDIRDAAKAAIKSTCAASLSWMEYRASINCPAKETENNMKDAITCANEAGFFSFNVVGWKAEFERLIEAVRAEADKELAELYEMAVAQAKTIKAYQERQWVDLTDDEILSIPYLGTGELKTSMVNFARAVIAKFKEKNK